MKKGAFVILLAILVTVAGASADTLNLRSGQKVQGTFLEGDENQVKFLGTDGQFKVYPLPSVSGITFAAPAPPPAPAAAPKPTSATVLAGTLIYARMIDSLDTSKTKTGDLFTASLDSDLVGNGIVVARRGASVRGKVTKSENAGRVAGKSELQLELTSIVINGAAQPISTSGFQRKGASSGASSAKKTAGGAGLGAIIGGISGNAGKGAAIGATSGLALSIATKGEAIRVPSETLLEFALAQPTTLPVAH
jgi:hypothetical protein